MNDVSTILVKRPVFVASPALLVATPHSLFNLSPLDMFLPHFMLHIHYPFFSLDILLPIKYVILFKHMNTYGISPTYLWPKTGHCISRFHRSPSASMAFVLAVATVAARECILGSFLLFNQGTWEVDQQSMGRNLQTWRCGVIWYNTTNGKRMPKQKRTIITELWQLTAKADEYLLYLGMWLGVFMDVITAKENIRWDRTLFLR